jgi:hypothetical protein
LQQKKSEKTYEDIQWNDDGILIYKSGMHIPNSLNLRIILMDEIHKIPYYGLLGYQKLLLQQGSNTFVLR